MNWAMLIIGGFLVTGAANCFNEIIEKDLDKLMTRTAWTARCHLKMTTGQALVFGLFMAYGRYLFIR
jgi:protoheme IX farnesyltransferase